MKKQSKNNKKNEVKILWIQNVFYLCFLLKTRKNNFTNADHDCWTEVDYWLFCEAVEIGSIPCCRGRNGHSSAWCDCLNKILKIVLVVFMTNAHNVLAVVFSYLFINMTYVHTYAYTERISTQALAILWLFSNPTLKILVADPANIFWAVMHTLTQIIRYRK